MNGCITRWAAALCTTLALCLGVGTASATGKLAAADLVGRWQLLGVTESVEQALEPSGPEQGFEFGADGSVRYFPADDSALVNSYEVEGSAVRVRAPEGEQSFEVLQHDGERMLWRLSVGDQEFYYHLRKQD